MKKISSLVISTLVTIASFAQNTTNFGLKGGVNIANLKSGTTTLDSRTGWNLGGFAHVHLSPHFALQPEVMYSSQGASNAQKLNYLNVPVLGQYMIGNGLRLQTGPQIGYRLNSTYSGSGHTSADLNSLYKRADFSWTLGAGYVTPIGLGFDVRYNHGLNNISKTATDVKNRVWQLGIFYQFGH